MNTGFLPVIGLDDVMHHMAVTCRATGHTSAFMSRIFVEVHMPWFFQIFLSFAPIPIFLECPLCSQRRLVCRLVCVIWPNWVAFGPYYAKVVEDTPIHSASEM